MRRLWAKIVGLGVLASPAAAGDRRGGGAGGRAPGDRGRHPEVYRLGGLVDQPV